MSLPNKPFDVIALSMSGGGYRAAAFHLGTLTLLDRVKIDAKYLTSNPESNNKETSSLLNRVKIISTVSGGTFTGVIYALCLAQDKGIQECYDILHQFMSKVNLIEESLQNLTRKKWLSPKQQNLINSFAKVYDEKLTNKETFNALYNESGSHLSEIIFNATDFSHGLAFRFQKTQSNMGRFGNYYTYISKDATKEIKLSDVIAASSCFPGGFEPILFPNDFMHSDAKSFNEFAASLLKKDHKDFPMSLMDGGIYDNQGIDSVILAAERMQDAKYYPELSNKANPVDLYIISDVSSPFMEPLKTEIKPVKKWYSKFFFNLSFAALKKLSILSWLITIASIIPIVYCSSKPMIALFSVLTTLFFLISVLLSFTGNILIKKVPKWFNDIPAYFMSPIKYFHKIKFNVYRSMIISRKDSVVKMVSEVFLKQVRRLSYRRIYENPEWENRRIMNAVYELNSKSVKKRLTDKKKILSENLLKPSQTLIDVAEYASETGTTLWFEPKELEGEKNRLNSLIATGQFTVCFSLLEYIDEIQSHKDYNNLDKTSIQLVESVKSQLTDYWKAFNKEPFWMVNK